MIILSMAALSLYIYAADKSDDTVPKSRMIWEISRLYNDSLAYNDSSANRPLCVNETIGINVLNRNTHKPLGSAFVRVFYGLDMVAAMYTEYTGVVYFTPNQTGVYKVFIQKLKYQDLRGVFNVTECTKQTTTTTTTTTTTSSTTTTTIAFDNPAATLPEEEKETTATLGETAPSATTPGGEGASAAVEPAFPECSSCRAKSDLFAVLCLVAVVVIVIAFAYLNCSRQKEEGKEGR